MRGLLFIVATMGILLSCGSAFGRQSFLPENELWREDNLYSFTGVDEDTFNKVLDKIYTIYAPIFKSLGGTLVVNRDYESSVVNAYADREGGTYNVSFFGGLARRKEVTESGFATVVCHELAHHYGGFPEYPKEWASSEGQSDYAAMRSCIKKYYADDTSNVASLAKIATDKCKATYSGQNLRVCYHSLEGAQSCSLLLSVLDGGKFNPELLDKSEVKRTSYSHPTAQCRWTTYIAGAVCKLKWGDKVSPTKRDQALYNCVIGSGARPQCWYARGTQS